VLQIKKKSKIVSIKYNMQFLFRNKNLAKKFRAKKIVSHSIILRSPKHFNIGKQKVLNLNYKTPKLFFKTKYSFFLRSLLYSDKLLFKLASKKIKLTPTLLVNSIRLVVKTSYKIFSDNKTNR